MKKVSEKLCGSCKIPFRCRRLGGGRGGGRYDSWAEVTHLALPVDPDDSVARIMLSGHKNGVRAE